MMKTREGSDIWIKSFKTSKQQKVCKILVFLRAGSTNDCKAALLKTLIPSSDLMNFTHSSNEQTKRNQNQTNYQELVKYFPIK